MIKQIEYVLVDYNLEAIQLGFMFIAISTLFIILAIVASTYHNLFTKRYR